MGPGSGGQLDAAIASATFGTGDIGFSHGRDITAGVSHTSFTLKLRHEGAIHTQVIGAQRIETRVASGSITVPDKVVGAAAIDLSQLPTDVMGARAGLHADQATWNIGDTAFELTA